MHACSWCNMCVRGAVISPGNLVLMDLAIARLPPHRGQLPPPVRTAQRLMARLESKRN